MSKQPIKEHILRAMCFRQLDILIQRGQCVERAKGEWYRRMALEYPYMKGMGGIKQYGE